MRLSLPAWIRYAFLAFGFMGLTNYLLGCIGQWSEDAEARVTAPMLVWVATGASGALVAARGIARGGQTRRFPGRGTVVVAGTAGVTLALGMLTLTLGLAADPRAHGPIVAIIAANAILVALLSLVILGERLTMVQSAGMAVVVAGIALVGLSAGEASFTGVGFGLVTMLLFGITNFLLKVAGESHEHAVSTTALVWLSSGACGVVAISVTMATGRGLAGIDTAGLLATALAAGFTLAAGVLCLHVAIARGPAGPAAAISGANAILVTLLDLAFFGHVPEAGKLAGMLIALAGIGTLALGRRGAASEVAPGVAAECTADCAPGPQSS